VPRIAFVNKMDRNGADFYQVLDMLEDRLGSHFVPVQLPIGTGETFTGLIDLIDMHSVTYEETSLGAEFHIGEIPEDLMEKALQFREKLLESVAEFDDHLLEKFLEGGEIAPEEIVAALRLATCALKAVPVTCGSAFKHKGVQRLLDAVVRFLPAPSDVSAVIGHKPNSEEEVERQPVDEAPFSALAFKIMTDPFVGRLSFIRVYSGSLTAGSYIYNVSTGKRERVSRLLEMHANDRTELKEANAGDIVAVVGLKETTTGDTICDEDAQVVLEKIEFAEPVVHVAIEPKTRADQESLHSALHKLAEEDPTFRVRGDVDTGQTVISGMGELHLEIITTQIGRDHGVPVNVGAPRVAYRQSILNPVDIEAKQIKQSGGSGQYAVVNIKFSNWAPDPTDEDQDQDAVYNFIDSIKSGTVPSQYIPSVRKGCQAAASTGGKLGWPFVGVQAELHFGKYHDVDSSELAFTLAAQRAFRAAVEGNFQVLEPVMKLNVSVPEEFLGDVIGDLNTRRIAIEDMSQDGAIREVRGRVPIAEMFSYAGTLRGMTQGRGAFSMEPDGYDPVPPYVQEELVKERLK